MSLRTSLSPSLYTAFHHVGFILRLHKSRYVQWLPALSGLCPQRLIFLRKASLVAQTVKNLPTIWETQVWSLGREDPLEKGMATHSSILAWGIPWIEELGGLYSPWGHKESGTTEQLISLSLSLWKGRFSSLIVQIKILSLSLAWIGFCVHPWTYLCGHKEKLL